MTLTWTNGRSMISRFRKWNRKCENLKFGKRKIIFINSSPKEPRNSTKKYIKIPSKRNCKNRISQNNGETTELKKLLKRFTPGTNISNSKWASIIKLNLKLAMNAKILRGWSPNSLASNKLSLDCSSIRVFVFRLSKIINPVYWSL